MVVPTGTWTPWRALADLPEVTDQVTYYRDGHTSGSADMLAEALRSDGVIRTLRGAIEAAENATLELAWYGYVDGGDDPVICTDEGTTWSGEKVDEPFECVVAIVDTTEL